MSLRVLSSGEFPTGLGIPPVELKRMLEPNSLKSRFLLCELALLGKGATTVTGLCKRLAKSSDARSYNTK